MIRLLLASFLCLVPGAVCAEERARVAVAPTRALSMDCVMDAARENGLPLAALVGILAAEGGKTGEAVCNKNGTWDLGAFQINTVHVNALQEKGMPSETVLRDGCVNAHAAAWLLRREYERTGNIWAAIGAYHSRTPRYRDAYISRVRRHLVRLGRNGLS
ncbi:MAG: lytic transglycosylase domain-containing protein [Desulfovibrio sp.]|nr:lytic transglycosylase domain-containing protein [Desulfovibrio sp.]